MSICLVSDRLCWVCDSKLREYKPSLSSVLHRALLVLQLEYSLYNESSFHAYLGCFRGWFDYQQSTCLFIYYLLSCEYILMEVSLFFCLHFSISLWPLYKNVFFLSLSLCNFHKIHCEFYLKLLKRWFHKFQFGSFSKFPILYGQVRSTLRSFLTICPYFFKAF